VRARLLLIAVALAVLAVAGPRHDGKFPTGLRQGEPASGQLATQPAPEPDACAIVSAAVIPSITVDTHLVPESRRHVRPAQGALVVSPHLPSAPHATAGPHSFPLLV